LIENAQQLFKPSTSIKPQRLVIDMRENGGGDFTLVREHLLPGLKQRSAINRTGHLFVVIGRDTFSAAMSNATDFKKRRKRFLSVNDWRKTKQLPGESTAGASEFTADSGRIQLSITHS